MSKSSYPTSLVPPCLESPSGVPLPTPPQRTVDFFGDGTDNTFDLAQCLNSQSPTYRITDSTGGNDTYVLFKPSATIVDTRGNDVYYSDNLSPEVPSSKESRLTINDTAGKDIVRVAGSTRLEAFLAGGSKVVTAGSGDDLVTIDNGTVDANLGAGNNRVILGAKNGTDVIRTIGSAAAPGASVTVDGFDVFGTSVPGFSRQGADKIQLDPDFTVDLMRSDSNNTVFVSPDGAVVNLPGVSLCALSPENYLEPVPPSSSVGTISKQCYNEVPKK